MKYSTATKLWSDERTFSGNWIQVLNLEQIISGPRLDENNVYVWAWWCSPVIPATWEAKAGGGFSSSMPHCLKNIKETKRQLGLELAYQAPSPLPPVSPIAKWMGANVSIFLPNTTNIWTHHALTHSPATELNQIKIKQQKQTYSKPKLAKWSLYCRRLAPARHRWNWFIIHFHVEGSHRKRFIMITVSSET